jgi:outer membrane lipoprotein-sorting protein
LPVILVSALFAGAYAAEVTAGKAPAGAAITTEEIVTKCSGQYAAARTYYEESMLSMVLDAEGRHEEDKIKAAVAFRRPSTIKVDLSGDTEAVLYLDGRKALYYDRSNDEYATRELEAASDFVTELDDLKLEFTPAGEGFAAAFKQDALETSEPKEITRKDKPAYEIEVKRASGKTDTFVFDRATLMVVEIRTVAKIETEEGPGSVTYTKSIDKLLIDQTPRDAAGKEIDVFSFTVPRTAREIKAREKGAGPEGAAKSASTSSKL